MKCNSSFLLAFTFFLIPSICLSQSKSSTMKKEVIVNLNDFNHTTLLYGVINGVVIDSIKLNNTFSGEFDSLVKLNDSIFQYIYSRKVLHSMHYQLVIVIMNNKLNISFHHRYYTDMFNETKYNDGIDGTFATYSYNLSFEKLDENILEGHYQKIRIERYLYSLPDVILKKDTSTSSNFFKYDNDYHVFCSNYLILDGYFKYFSNNFGNDSTYSRIKFNNQLMPLAEFGGNDYFFYNGYWFYPNYLDNSLLSLRELNLESFSKDWKVKFPLQSLQEIFFGDQNYWSIKKKN